MSFDPTSSVSPQNTLSYLNQDNEIKPIVIKSRRDPSTRDRRYRIGTFWINIINEKSYQLIGSREGKANWLFLGGGISVGVDSLQGDTGAQLTGNVEIKGGDTTVVNGAGTILTINASNAGYPTSPYVVGASGEAGYQTIQSALDAANTAGGNATIIVTPGTYTENLTLYNSVDITGNIYTGCRINGVHTPPTTGRFSFQNLTLQSSTSIFDSTSAGTADLSVEQCIIDVSNGYIYNLQNWIGSLLLDDCGSIGGNDGVVNNTAGALVKMADGGVGNGTNPMILSGSCEFDSCEFACPVTFQTGSTIDSHATEYFSTVTLSGNCAGKFHTDKFETGSNPALTMNSTGNISINLSSVDSTNNPAITGTGTGTLILNGVNFLNNSQISSSLILASGEGRGGNVISRYIVGNAPDAVYQTIQSALDAANAAGINATIIVTPGTYNENLTLYDGVDIAGNIYTGCIINGVHTPPTSGRFTFQNLILQSSTHIFNSTSAGTADLLVEQCVMDITNGYIYNLPNWTGQLFLDDCGTTSTNDGVVNNTAGALVKMADAGVGNGTNPMIISGSAEFDSCEFSCPIDFQTVSIIDSHTTEYFDTVTLSNNSTGLFEGDKFDTGSNAAITMNSTGNIILANSTIDSTNNPAIGGTGTGALALSGVDFVNNSQVAALLNLSTIPRSTSGGLSIVERANSRMGAALLTAGTAIIPTTAVTAISRIFLTTQIPGGTVGSLHVSARIGGTQFTITSSSGADTSFVAWMIVEPA